MKKILAFLYFGLIVAANLLPIGLARAGADPANLIANPSVETADPSNPGQPQGWLQGGWGVNSSSLTYQPAGHTGSRSLEVQTTIYSSGDAKWYFAPVAVTAGAQYTFSDYYQSNISSDLVVQYDDGNGNYKYADLGGQGASSGWSQISESFIVPAGEKNLTVFHLISSVGWLQTDDYSLTAYTAPSVPTVTITSPAANSIVSGSTQLTASASAADGVKSVQFKIDGNNQGPAITASPYQTTWDTSSIVNGSHSITAVVTDTASQTATSAAVAVTVNNQAGGNLIPNPSLETADPSNAKQPQNWTNGSWGTNKTTFSYLKTGHSGQRSIKTQITSYTNGAAYWFSGNIAVTAGQMYDFSDYYESNVTSEVDAGITMSDGSQQDMYIGDAFASPKSWTEFRTQFTVPAGAVAITFYHNIYSAGWLTTDDYSLTSFAYQGFNRPIVSLDFDDGYESFYDYGLPLLQKYGFESSDFIITGTMGTDPNYMTSAQVKQLYVDGQDVESHTVSHPDLVTLSATKQNQELKNSQSSLKKLLGVNVKGLATPYGSANNQVLTDAAKYYSFVRGVEAGYNSKNNFDPYNILVQNVEVTTPVSQVEQWIQQAQASHTWLVLVYHQVDPTLTDETAEPYNTYPSDLDAELSYLHSSGVAVETMSQALQEIQPQL